MAASSWLTFTPGYFDGSGPWGEIAATQVIFWEKAPGKLTDEQTAFDYVVLVMEERIGDVVGYPGYRTYDDDWNGGAYWQYIGYPGELVERRAARLPGRRRRVERRRGEPERADRIRAGALQRIHAGPVGRLRVGLVGQGAVAARRRRRQHDRQHRRAAADGLDDAATTSTAAGRR